MLSRISKPAVQLPGIEENEYGRSLPYRSKH
jgi:hypothetical protein